MQTFEQILENIADLPVDQQTLLVEIVSRRVGNARRQQLAQECREGLTEFRAGGLSLMTADEAIFDLQDYLATVE
jgi:hypothetical protein